MPEARRGNGYDKDVTRQYVGRIDGLKSLIASYTGEHMQRCRKVRDDINGVFEEAKDAGLPKRELKAVIKARELEAKAKAARENLDDMDRIETFDQIRLALGDLSELPLGAEPLSQAPDAPDGDPNAEAALRNAEALAGIKGMRRNRGAMNGRPAAEPADGVEPDMRPDFLRRGAETYT